MDGSVIGVDLGGTKILAGRVRPDGTVVERREEPTDLSSAEAILAQIVAVTAALAGADDVRGVGVGIPSTINQERGEVLQSVNVPLRDLPVRDRLAAVTGLEVAIDNDANCAALGEHVYGAAGPYPHSLMLTLGTGLGGGIVVDGRIYHGATGGAGELGHIVVDRNGPPCQGSCPGRGHLEALCSGTALGRIAAEHVARHPTGTLAGALEPDAEPDARFVVERLEDGDAEAARLVETLARDLGAGLVSLANAFEPSVFVIGGGFGEAAAGHLIGPAVEVLRAEALHPMNAIPVLPARLGRDAGMIGAAELLRVAPLP